MENGSDRASNGPFDDDPQNGVAEAKEEMMAAIEAALGAISAAIQGAIGKIGQCITESLDESKQELISLGPASKNAIPLQDWEYERSKLHNEPAEYKLQHFVNCLDERVVKYSAAIFGTIASASDGMTPEYSKLYGDFTTGMLFESGCTVAGSGIKSVSALIRGEEVSKESVIAGSGIGNLGGKGNSAYKGVSNSDIVEVEISRSRYPESAKHIEDAIIANGQPEVLTIDRVGKKANRRASLKGIDKVPGEDLDEYPPAMFKEGGNGASVRSINPSDNRGAGSSFGHKLRPYQNGTRIKFRITDD